MFDDLIKKGLDEKAKTEFCQQEKREIKFLGKMRRNTSHTLFSYNLVTKEIKVAELEKPVTIGLFGMEKIGNTRIIIEKDCVYRQALNKKNFIKILKREGIIE